MPLGSQGPQVLMVLCPRAVTRQDIWAGSRFMQALGTWVPVQQVAGNPLPGQVDTVKVVSEKGRG